MKRILYLSFLFLFSIHLSAQKSINLFGMKVKHIGASIGLDQDMLKNMDHTYLISSARGNTSAFSDLEFGKQDMESMNCENPHVRIDVSLLPQGVKNLELRLALLGIFDRIDAVHYSKGHWVSQEH